jgi:hypothetical protein
MWFEDVGSEFLEDVAQRLGNRLGSRSTDLFRLCERASATMEVDPRPEWKHPETGSIEKEPLGEAVQRLGVPVDGGVCLLDPMDASQGVGVRLRMKDLVAFEKLIWWRDAWLLDEDGAWLLEGWDERRARWLDLRRPG